MDIFNIGYGILKNYGVKFTDIILSNPNISESYMRNYIQDQKDDINCWDYIKIRDDLSEQFIIVFYMAKIYLDKELVLHIDFMI